MFKAIESILWEFRSCFSEKTKEISAWICLYTAKVNRL